MKYKKVVCIKYTKYPFPGMVLIREIHLESLGYILALRFE